MPQINPDYGVPPVQRKRAYYTGDSTSASSTSKSSVEVSHTARELHEALNLAQRAPDVREDRVAELRARIASGQYNPDLDRLAEFLASKL